MNNSTHTPNSLGSFSLDQESQTMENGGTFDFALLAPLTKNPPSAFITPRQHQLLIGCLLADGGIQVFKNRHTRIVSCRFYEKHTPRQKDICDFLYTELPFTKGVTQPPKIVKSGKYVEIYTGKTLSLLPYVASFYHHQNGSLVRHNQKIVKRVPENIGDCLTTGTALAMWLAGDGSLLNHGHDLVLYTNCFPFQDHMLLQKALEQNFGIQAQIRSFPRKRGKGEFVLCLPHDQAVRFLDQCDPTVMSQLDSIKYKFQVRGYRAGSAGRRVRRVGIDTPEKKEKKQLL